MTRDRFLKADVEMLEEAHHVASDGTEYLVALNRVLDRDGSGRARVVEVRVYHPRLDKEERAHLTADGSVLAWLADILDGFADHLPEDPATPPEEDAP